MSNPTQAKRVCALRRCGTLFSPRFWRWGGALLLCCVLVISRSAPLHSQETGDETAAEPATYTVQRGETLSEIAVGLGVSMPLLMQLNGITDSDQIYVGQILRIPLDASLLREDADETAAEAPELGAPVLPGASHTVRRGETLSEIAQAYDVEMSELMRVNGIVEPDAVYVGQTLALPSSPADPAQEPTATLSTTVTPDISPPDTSPADQQPADQQPAVLPTEPPASPPAAEPTTGPTRESTAESIEGPTEEPTAEPTEEPIEELTPMQRATTLNRFYTVRTNDTLARIALRTGVDLEALRQINGMNEESVFLVVGQTLLLPATAADLAVKPEAEDPGQVYQVEPGDSLSGIAKAHGIAMAELMNANGIVNPDSIRIGQSLRIPEPQEESTEEAAPTSVGPARRGFYYYTVGVGDTLSQLAGEFQSTVLALLEYNGLPDEQTVYLGLELRIPYGPPDLPLSHPRVPQSGTSFLVSLSRQQCWVFRGDRVLHEWTCSTGYGQHTTRTGTFAVQTRMELAKSGAYQLDMPYWLGIYDVGSYENGIHGLPVRWDTGKKIWEHLIGQPATFGCAMLADEEAAELFGLSYLGMPVHVVN